MLIVEYNPSAACILGLSGMGQKKTAVALQANGVYTHRCNLGPGIDIHVQRFVMSLLKMAPGLSLGDVVQYALPLIPANVGMQMK